MNKQVKRNLEEWLDDRKNIMESFDNPADGEWKRLEGF